MSGHVDGMFDFTPSEEVVPIWITDRLVTLFGEMDEPAREGVVSLRLLKDPLFGTGGHPSTKLAIWSLLGLSTEGAGVPSPFVEIGPSTGILALVAAASGAGETYHASANERATALSEDNGFLNGYTIHSEPLILAFDPEERADFYGCAATQTGSDSSTLEMIPHLFDSLRPGAFLIWAGHTAKHHQIIKGRLEEFFEPHRVDDFIGWPVLIMQKAKE